MTSADTVLFERIWSELGGAPLAPDSLIWTGAERLLLSAYDVAGFASATVASAAAGIAAVHSVRTGEPARAIRVDRGHAAVAFRSERYVTPIGWSLPSGWDPLAGDYPTRDGWIRLHTNYRHHREAVLRVLGVPESREEVARAVRGWSAEDLEGAVVGEGGCAARSRTATAWAAHPQGQSVAREPLVAVTALPTSPPELRDVQGPPLAGIRVLDLTRVVAGPVCTRVLAAFGADVLRVDPRGFEEVGALLPEMTVGKRRTFLDLRATPDRLAFERLITGAHVMVHGYRSDALERLGFGAARRRALNPSLIDVSLDAYGFMGPWANRRGFDSLVQMSVGIADRGQQATGADRPVPLPAQALDHGTGYLLAAATCRALVRVLVDREASEVHLSLARTAKLLVDLGDSGEMRGPDMTPDEVERCSETASTAFGPVTRVRCPVRIDGNDPCWTVAAGPLGVDAPVWR